MDAQYDVVIFGTGPAGLQAAIHAARKKVRVLVMGREQKSSLYRAHIENYCCIERVTGEEMLRQGIDQATRSGAAFLHEDVIKTAQAESGFTLTTESGRSIHTHTLILAMGISRNRLGVPGEKELIGKGVSYCVDCDANFYKGARVVVTGNESAAVSGALTMLFYAAEVHLVADQLQVAESLALQVRESNVVLHDRLKIKEITGGDEVQGVILDNGETIDADGVFIETGAKGAIELAATLGVALDEEKFEFIVADKQQQTNLPGIYAAGDICGPPWQMAKAVGEGCVAGLAAAKYAKKAREK
ncbi:MAG: FAD-dependent oxidoreductase [Desulfobacterales bacterium]|nr:FAD-dependent oxidoreductase [Desulfobacterales bacterium]